MRRFKAIIIAQIIVVCCLNIFACSKDSGTANSSTQGTLIDEGRPNSEAEDSQSLSIESDLAANELFSLEYSGAPFVEVNGNMPGFSDEEKLALEAFEIYSELDEYDRCGPAYANICKELMPTEERGAIGNVRPSGWHTANYHELIDGNYLYNRCHLIGYQLAGENANEKNLITGTRYLNVVGMLQFENKIADYVDETNHHVLYRVTPVFKADELVARGVLMEAWSVEDGGKGICFCVYCFNVQPRISIDYATGESEVDESYIANATTEEDKEGASNDYESNTENTFIINVNSKKFHLPSCSSVSDMADHNKKEYRGTIEELIEQGNSPCKRCLPGY